MNETPHNTLARITHQGGVVAFEVNHQAIAGLNAEDRVHLEAALSIVERLVRDGAGNCPGLSRGMLTCPT
ncbi:hypothetical protein D3C86_2133200 [compost metagenome]